MNILVAGDFCQKYRVDEAVRSKQFGKIFDEVKSIIESADYSIVNFEFPIVLDSKIAKPIQKCGPNLKGTIEAVEAIKYAGFKCCTLANNHILDQGDQCCLDTKIELEKASIDTVGAGKNIEEASKILYKEINGEVLALINCCEHEFSIATDTSAGANPLNPIAQYYKIQEARKNADYVIVIVHGGIEHYQLPSPRMQDTYRFFIEVGADTVVNHHQHCYSGYEIYKGKPIFYGLGNFLFDRLNTRNSIWNEGYVVKLSLRSGNVDYQLLPYKQCNETTSVNFMNEEENERFYHKINELNEIIKDDNLLKEKISAFFNSNDVLYRMALEPYSNRYARALWKRGFLPSFLTEDRILLLQNFITCESHYERMVHQLKRI